MHTPDTYYLFLCDLRDSTRLEAAKAGEATAIVDATLETLNTQFAGALAVPLQLSYGDEITGLFTVSAPILDVVSTLRHALRTVTALRFVVCHGRIGSLSDDMRKVGGPAFKQAIEAITGLKSSGAFCRWLLDDRLLSDTIEALTESANAFLETATDYQYQVYTLLAQGRSQRVIAKDLDKFPQSVSDAVKRARLELVIRMDQLIRRHLMAMDQQEPIGNH